MKISSPDDRETWVQRAENRDSFEDGEGPLNKGALFFQCCPLEITLGRLVQAKK